MNFLHEMPECRRKYPADLAQRECPPWPSNRSWTNAIQLLAAGESVGANDATIDKMVIGCVGIEAASQFRAYRTKLGLPDAEAILADPKSLVLPARGDLVKATLASVWAAVHRNCTPERWEAAREVLAVAETQSPEWAAASRGTVEKMKPAGYNPIQRKIKRGS